MGLFPFKKKQSSDGQPLEQLIPKLNKLYDEANLFYYSSLCDQIQNVIGKLQRAEPVPSSVSSMRAYQLMDRLIADSIFSLQTQTGQAAACQNLLAIQNVLDDMASPEKAKFYADDHYFDCKTKLAQQEALIAAYRETIDNINAQARRLATDATTIGLTPTALNEQVKRLYGKKQMLNEKIQQCERMILTLRSALEEFERANRVVRSENLMQTDGAQPIDMGVNDAAVSEPSSEEQGDGAEPDDDDFLAGLGL